MAKKILMGASFLALLAAFPAFAADTSVKADVSTETSVGSTLGNTLNKVETTVSDTAQKAKAATKDTYNDVKAYFSDDDDLTAMTSVNVANRLTSEELIGTNVKNAEGKSIGKIDDVLVDKDGDVERVIINDGGILNLGGKLVSVDYDDIGKLSAQKDLNLTLSQKDLKGAVAFDYGANVPADLFRVSKISGAKVVDTEGKTVAKVNDVAFDGDEADYAIVTFDKVLGMGGEKAALDFEALDLVNTNGDYSFKLNAQQSAQFHNYKQTTKTN